MNLTINPTRFHDLHEGDVVRWRATGRLMLVAIADGEASAFIECVWIVSRCVRVGTFEASAVDFVLSGAFTQ